jgi:type IV pilus assembly protein PilQ
MRKNGNVLWIAPKDELAAKEKVELEAQKAIRRTRAAAHAVVPAELHQGRGHRKRPHLQPPVAQGGGGTSRAARRILLSRAGSVIAEPRTNQLFVTDIPSKLEQIRH